MPAGRPRKQLDKKQLESLLAIGCTRDECVAFFDNLLDKGCSESTFLRWVKREYGENFETLAAKKRLLGRISLRRAQLALAEKNASMAIFLGKNWLGQSDNPQESIDTEDTEAYLAEAGLDDKSED